MLTEDKILAKAVATAVKVLGVPEHIALAVPLSCVVIYQYLHTLLGGDTDRIKEWMHTPNKAFEGKSAVELLEADELNIEVIKNYLGAIIYG
jgi:hypothetical protein